MDNIGQDTPKPGIVAYSVITSLYIAFILYASFFPSGGNFSDAQGLARLNDVFLDVSTSDPLDQSRRLLDWAVNLLLYLPLGILLAAFGAYGKGDRRPARIHPLMFSGLLLSLGVEVTQGLLGSGRYSDIADLGSNSLGCIFGFLLATFAFKKSQLHPATLLGLSTDDHINSHHASLFAYLRLCYVGLFLLISVLPLELLTSPSAIYAKLNTSPAQWVLNPLTLWRMGNIETIVLSVLVFIPFAALSSLLGDDWRKTTLLCLLLALAGEGLALFISDGHSDSGIVLLAGLTAIATTTAFFFIRPQRSQLTPSTNHGHNSHSINLLFACYALFLCAIAWSPFEFELSFELLRQKIANESNWLPFALHIQHPSLSAAIDIGREALLGLPLGILAGLRFPQARAVTKINLMLLCLGFMLCIELSQGMVIGRTIDITDALCALLGAILGWQWVSLRQAPHPSSIT